MRALKRIFSKELTRTQRIQSWQFLGPLSLLFTASLLSMGQAANTDLLLCMLFGSLLIWKEPKRGWIFSLSLLSLSIFLKHLQIEEDHLWQLGLETCVAIGHILTYLGLKESSIGVDDLQEENKAHLDEIFQIEEKHLAKARLLDSQKGLLEDRLDLLKKELYEKQEKVESLENLNDTLRKNHQNTESPVNVAEIDRKKDRLILELQFEMAEVKEELEGLQDVQRIRENNRKLIQELNKHRVDAYQSKLTVDMLRQMLANLKEKSSNDDTQEKLLQAQRVIESLEEQIANQVADQTTEKYQALQKEFQKNTELLRTYETKFQELKSQETALKQLRKQFVEKGDVLQQTRKELFQTENELLAMRKDQEEWALHGSMDLSGLMADFQALFHTMSKLEEENEQLSEVITELMEDPEAKEL